MAYKTISKKGKKKLPKLGNGKRFKTLKQKFAKKGIKNPGGLTAKIGREKYGKKKFQAMAKKGKARKAKK